MIADIQLNGELPHGTLAGYAAGCRGSHCPGALPCQRVYLRYQGDYGFRKAMDAGMTLAEIVAREARAAPEPGTRPTRPRVPKLRERRTPSSPVQKQVAALVEKGYTDRQIGEAIGRTRDQVSSTRTYLGIPANRTRTPAIAGVSSSRRNT